MYLEIIGQIVYRATLVFTNNLFSQQFGQGSYGIASASEIAFFSYIYGKLEKDQYQRLTSWTRAGTMAGRTGGYIVAQILILTGTGTYVLLNQVAFSFSCLALVFCFLMPRVSWKKLVDRIRVEQDNQKSRAKSHTPLPTSYKEYILYRLGKLRSDFVKVYSNPFICKWSFWWAITTCMSLQISLYSQTLFGQAQGPDEIPLNGFADAGYTFTATVGILLLNSLPINWNKWGETALVIISTLDAIFLYIYSTSTSAYPMYIVYIFYRSFYQVMITIAQWNIAKKMVCDSYGLVFGVNSFIALIMQSLLTRVVSDKRGLGMQVRDAFLVYASLHALIAMIFLISVIYTVVCWYCKRDKIAPTTMSSKRTSTRKHSSIKVKNDKNQVENLQGIPSSATLVTDIASIASTDNTVATNSTTNPKSIDDKNYDIASELDFSSSSEDETDSDEDKVPGLPTETLASSFAASMSRKLSKPM
uniref:Thiamine transporter 1 n=1 Tax=Panagrolaimus sp. ES5 TaxID=591445 RepID=A0AC34FDS1_9BILA